MKKNISNNRRYYLHRRLKKIFPVYARKKEVCVPACIEGTPPLYISYLKELATAGYNIQTTIQ